MAYTPTAWQDDETLVNAQRMNNIESGVKNANDNKSDINHNHDDRYSKLDHNHDDRYAKKDETYTKTEVDLKIDPIKKEIKDLQGQILFIKRIICNFARFHELEATVNKILTI